MDFPVATDLEPWLTLHDKVVMITGASSGLGREFCLDLAKAGCRVIATARRMDRLQSLCDEINSRSNADDDDDDEPIRAVAVALDVSASGAAIADSVGKAWNAFGRIDALINNAGVRGRVHSPLDLSEEEWDEIVRTNLRGTWLVSKCVCTLMKESKQTGGSVINISSIDGIERVHPRGGLAYVATKAAINAITKVMALELGGHNIRVNCIAVGLFKSEITQDLMGKKWLKNVVRRTVPLRDLGEVDPALTSLIRYLIHDDDDDDSGITSCDHHHHHQFVTGNIFIVDSGTTLPAIHIFSSL